MSEVKGWREAGEILTQARYHQVGAEVVIDAMAMIKEDPTMDSVHALAKAANNWDVNI